MNQLDFDDLLRHKLDKSGAELAPTDMEWGGLSERLSQHMRWQKWLLWGSLAMLLILLLGGNLYWLNQNRQLQSALSTMNVSTKTQQNKVIIDQVDTVIRRTTVVLYDTIYRSVRINQMQSGAVGFLQNSVPALGASAARAAESAGKKATEKASTSLSENKSVLPSFGTDKGAISSQNSENLTENSSATAPVTTAKSATEGVALLPNLPLKSLNYEKLRNISKADFLQPAPTKVTRRFRPDITIGLVVGSPKFIDDDLESNAGMYGAAQASIKVWRRLSLVSEVGFQNIIGLGSKTLKQFPLGVDVPTAEPNLDFKEWGVRELRSFNYALGAKYCVFSDNKKWSPYLIGGYQGLIFGKYETRFEYRNEVNDPVFITRVSNKQQKDNIDAVYGGLGAELRLNQHFHLMLESSINRQIESNKRFDDLPPQIMLKAGALYRF